jgi:hypothetical protein
MMISGFERTVVRTDGWEPCTILHNVVKPRTGGYHKLQALESFVMEGDGGGPGFSVPKRSVRSDMAFDRVGLRQGRLWKPSSDQSTDL